MHCSDVEENLESYLEDLLEPPEYAAMQAHLDACATCRETLNATRALRQQLAALACQGQRASQMDAILSRLPKAPSRVHTLQRTLGWLGAAATLLLAVGVAAGLAFGAHQTARAAEVLRHGAQTLTHLKSVHFVARMRSRSIENFSHLDPSAEFTRVECWRELGEAQRWRVEKGERSVAMDGQSTVMWIHGEGATRIPMSGQGAFDTDWILRLADPGNVLESQVNLAKARGWKMNLEKWTNPDGRALKQVTVQIPSGLPQGDYLKGAFLDASDMRRVYRFDAVSDRLESVQFFLKDQDREVLVFEVETLEFDPVFSAETFMLHVPEGTPWDQGSKVLAANDPRRSMNPEVVARAFFEACASGDWTRANAYASLPFSARFQAQWSGLTLVRLGPSFTSQAGPQAFVPYDVRFRDGTHKRWNLALRREALDRPWMIDGGL